MRLWIQGTALLAMAIALGGSAFAAQGRGGAKMRFKEMDKNGDGRVVRAEWRGSARSFEVHDWNADGVLSGDELRPGASRQARGLDQEDLDSPQREPSFDDWTVRGFEAVDHNRDRRITADEWHFEREGFRRADHDGNGVISRAEFLNEEAIDDDRGDPFSNLDGNSDGRIARTEWHGTAALFAALDHDRSGFLTPNEIYGDQPPPDLFSSVDVNRDGSIARQEWHWSASSFDQRDVNRDGRLSVREFSGAETLPSRSQAYRAGHARGLVEGRQAGMEDGARKTWDIDGQRELEQADSGYSVEMGPRPEYQAGYREGFRSAYREGYGK